MHKIVCNILLAITLMGVAVAADAQTACPQGVAAGSAQCGPSGASMLGNGTTIVNPPPRQPQARWKLTWGALAHELETGWVGFSTGQRSKRKAERAAVDNCKSRGGGKGCIAVLAYHHQCAVIATPREKLNSIYPIFQAAGSIEKATEIGLKECQMSNAGHECKIFYSNCTEPYLVYD